MPTQKSLNQLLASLNLYQYEKNHFIPSFYFWDTVNFRVPWPDWPHPFLTNVHTHKFWSAFNLCEIVPAWKKSVNSNSSFLKYNQFNSPEIRLATAIFDYAWPKQLPSTFNFCGFVSACKKWGCFIHLFQRNGWLKYSSIWMAESIFRYKIAGTRSFPNRGFVQEHSK